MQTLPPNASVQETYVPLLLGAQSYLKAILDNKAPDSLVSQAWDDFYHAYDGLIRRFVITQGVPRSDVDDCVQEVWSEVAARLVTFNRPADRPGLRAWLYVLVRSKATNVFRKRARQPTVNLERMMSEGYEPADSQTDPAALCEMKWERALLDSVVEQLREELSATNARILQMRIIERRSVEDVIAELKLAPASVHARQHRIMKKLRARIALYTGAPLG